MGGGGGVAEGERERERESVEQQSKHALIPIYNKNKKQTKFSPMRALSRPARSAGSYDLRRTGLMGENLE